MKKSDALSGRMAVDAQPPPASHLTHLRPSDPVGLLFLGSCLGLTGFSIFLSAFESPVPWLAGQILLAIALIQWFVILHECGHETLFRTNRLHIYAGHLASFFSVIPFHCWREVHGMHHRWTGWQDMDPTTASLVPRKLGRAEKAVINACWKSGIPLFSVFYRAANFWNPPRLRILFQDRARRQTLAWNILLLFTAYAVSVYWVGFGQSVRLVGLGFLLSLIFQDPLLLSQHTHIPLNLSHGEKVKPYPALQQEVFTRSLRFPSWFSTCVLLNFDAHELHHMYPFIPGYRLRSINYSPENEINWWRWIRGAKQLPGEVFLFQNRNQSGVEI